MEDRAKAEVEQAVRALGNFNSLRSPEYQVFCTPEETPNNLCQDKKDAEARFEDWRVQRQEAESERNNLERGIIDDTELHFYALDQYRSRKRERSTLKVGVEGALQERNQNKNMYESNCQEFGALPPH